MNRFTPLLRRISDRLDLPQPARSRILLEIAADLEDLYHAYREKGLDEKEAAARAEETLDVSDEALVELSEIHRTPFRRWLDRFTFETRTRWERLVLLAMILFVTFFTGRFLLSSRFFATANIFIWPVLGISLLSLTISMAKVYTVYIKKDHDIRRLRSGLPSLLFLGSSGLFFGVYGFTFEFYRCLKHIQLDAHKAGYYFVQWLVGGSTTMIISHLTAIAIALVWFSLITRVARIEQAEAACLLDPDGG